MANEIKVALGIPGRTLYAILRNLAGLVFRNSTGLFETYNAANWSNYAILLTEQGTGGDATGFYMADLPAGAVLAETIEVRERATGTPLLSDITVAIEDLRVKNLMEADQVINTTTIPWTLEYRYKGTTSILMTKQLKQLDGNALASSTVPIGQKVA